MTKQEHIEEMANYIAKCCPDKVDDGCFDKNMNCVSCIATELYNAGYRKIDDLKAEIKQLKTECALLDDELRIARQETIDVLNKLKTKAFDKDAFNGWAGSTFVVLVRDIDKMIEELTKCRR